MNADILPSEIVVHGCNYLYEIHKLYNIQFKTLHNKEVVGLKLECIGFTKF